VDDLDEAASTAHLLEVVEKPRRRLFGINARPTSTLALQTDSRSNVDERGLKQGVSRERGARGAAVRVRLDPHPQRPPATLLQPVISKKQASCLPGLLPLRRGAFSASCAACVGEGLGESRWTMRPSHSSPDGDLQPLPRGRSRLEDRRVSEPAPPTRAPDRISPHAADEKTGRF
jgi:hypothetical protein